MSAWSAPERPRRPSTAGERESLEAFVDHHRATLLVTCAGLTPEQLASRSCPPSTLSLLGLVRHMAEVERNWFRRVLDRQEAPPIFYSPENPDGDFDDVDPTRVDEDLAVYQAEVAAAREVAARYELGRVGHWRHAGQDVSLRWIYVHMIEEYARHNGHADLLREMIDGRTGERASTADP